LANESPRYRHRLIDIVSALKPEHLAIADEYL